MKETGLSRVSKNLIIKEVEKEAEKRGSRGDAVAEWE